MVGENKFLVTVAAVAIAFLIFGNTLPHPFLFDDVHLENYRHLYRLDKIDSFFVSPYHFIKSGVYRPLAMVSYAINQLLLGESVAAFRIFQIILFGLNGALLFFVLKKLHLDQLTSLLATLVFLFHPINTVVVNVITYRHDMLYVTFGLLAIMARLSGKILLAYFLFFLSLMSKEFGVAVMAIVIYYLVFLKPDQEGKNLRQRLVAVNRDFKYGLITMAIYLLFRLQALKELFFYDPTTIVENPLRYLPYWSSILTAIKVMGLYVSKLIYPRILSIDYSYNQIPPAGFFEPLTILGLMVLLACGFVLFPRVKLDHRYKIAVALFLFPLLIVSNLFFKIGAIVGERWLYLPSTGFGLLLATFLPRVIGYAVKRRHLVFLSTLVPILLLFSLYLYRDWQRNKDWADSFSLYASTAQAAPNSVLARNNLGAVYLLRKDYQKAKIELEAATKIYSDYPQLLLNWGVYYKETGELVRAEEYLLKTIAVEPDYTDAYSHLIGIYISLGDYDKAIRVAEKRYRLSSSQEHLEDLEFLLSKTGRRLNE